MERQETLAKVQAHMATTQKEVLTFLKTLIDRLPQEPPRFLETTRNAFNAPREDTSAAQTYVDLIKEATSGMNGHDMEFPTPGTYPHNDPPRINTLTMSRRSGSGFSSVNFMQAITPLEEPACRDVLLQSTRRRSIFERDSSQAKVHPGKIMRQHIKMKYFKVNQTSTYGIVSSTYHQFLKTMPDKEVFHILVSHYAPTYGVESFEPRKAPQEEPDEVHFISLPVWIPDQKED